MRVREESEDGAITVSATGPERVRGGDQPVVVPVGTPMVASRRSSPVLDSIEAVLRS